MFKTVALFLALLTPLSTFAGTGSGDFGGGISQSQVGQPNGVASLDNTGKVPLSQIPGGGGGSATWGAITGTLSSQTDLNTALSGKQASLGFTPEDVANKSIDGTLSANSDTLYSSQKAVKTYADTKQSALGFTPENVANKDTDGTLSANSDTKYASQKATKTYADTKQSALGFTPENVANKSIDGTLSANSDTLYPSQKAVKTYADTKQSALTPGTISSSTSGVHITGGSNSTVGPSVTVDLDTATNSQPGIVSAADHTIFAAKQDAFAGTTLQYVRGDASLATLNTAIVPELTNLYYTNARALAAPITGYVSGAGTVAATDTILQAIQKLNGNAAATAGAAITSLTNDVVASGPGAAAATIQAGAVTNSKMASMADQTVKGNVSGSSAAPSDLSAAQLKTLLNLTGTNSGDVTLGTTNGLSLSGQQLSLQAATDSVAGALTAADHTAFNAKFTLPSFTAGSVPYANGTTLIQDNTNFFFDDTNKSLSVGPGPHPATSADLAISSQAGDTKVGLSVFSTSTNNAVQIQNQSGFSLAALVADATNSPSINFERARGTLASKTQAKAGDLLGSFVFNGYTGSADGPFAAGFGAVALEDQAAGHGGAEILFQTTPIGSGTLATRMVLDSTGKVQIPGLTVSRALVTDASSNLAVSATTATQVGYLSTATSDIQTQINLKQARLLTVTNGGNAAYTILSTDDEVRAGTTLTADRAYTLPACVSGNVGERHLVKNPFAQTFNITLTGAGSDLIEGNATMTIYPSQSLTAVCAAAAVWDIN